ncbi:MAG: tyrosine-type recombinase/integrase [Acidimicrobiales bacterium]
MRQSHPHVVLQAFTRAQRQLDVTPIRFHDLRHTHASLLLRDRVLIKVVSERLGHSDPAFTITTYQHVLRGMQDDAAAAFGECSPRSHEKPQMPGRRHSR